MTVAARKTSLETKISAVVGAAVEITVRADTEFTFSVDHIDQDLEFRLVSFFGKSMIVTDVCMDDECGTFVYMRAA
jgi:hypothetical protein